MTDFEKFLKFIDCVRELCGSLMCITLFDESHSDFSDVVFLKFDSSDSAVRFYLFLDKSLSIPCSLFLSDNVIRVLIIKD